MVSVRDVRLQDGRNLRVHDSGEGHARDGFTVLWSHGSPQTGALLEPLLLAASARGIRLLSYGRPSYGGSSPHAGRDVAAAAADVAQIADALGIARFAVMGASGGGRMPWRVPHCCPGASRELPAWRAWPPSPSKGSTGSGGWPPTVPPCARRCAATRRAKRMRRQRSSIPRASTSATMPRWQGPGRRWEPTSTSLPPLEPMA